MAKEVDYLTEDPVNVEQRFCIINIFEPRCDGVRAVKVRGVYSSYEEAAKKQEYFAKLDNNAFNVYIGEVGKWLPFVDDPEKAKDSVYPNQKLNELMKSYHEDQEKAKLFERQRVNELVQKARLDSDQKKSMDDAEVGDKIKEADDMIEQFKNSIKLQEEERALQSAEDEVKSLKEQVVGTQNSYVDRLRKEREQVQMEMQQGGRA